jgi:hypothetical protein
LDHGTAPIGRLRGQTPEVVSALDEIDQTCVVESLPEGELMVVHSLSIPLESGHDDRPLPGVRRHQDRSGAGVGDYEPCGTSVRKEGIVWQEVEADRPRRADGRRPVLDDDGFAIRPSSDRFQQPVEPRLVRSDCDQDHQDVSRLPT